MGRFYLVLGITASLALMVLVVMGAKVARAESGAIGDPAPPCGDTKIILKMLTEKYNESLVGLGLNGNGEMVSLFVSKAGTYTILISSPKGYSCIAGGGTDWSMKPAVPQGKES